MADGIAVVGAIRVMITIMAMVSITVAVPSAQLKESQWMAAD
jgi:hypothetical protein